MKQELILEAFILLALTICNNVPAAYGQQRERFFLRRQAVVAEQPEKEKEATAPAATGAGSQMPARMYPDLPRMPDNNGQHQHQQHFGGFAPNGPPTPFLPSFGFNPAAQGAGPLFMDHGQVPGSPFTRMRPQHPQMMGSMTPLERQQSLTFTNGLGARLLAMIGINNNNNNNNSPDDQSNNQKRGDNGDQSPMGNGNPPEATMRALQNSTVLSQLNRGVQNVYGSLSKMYNTTVQQQLNLLQERFNKETENSTNPWQQRMAKQVPEFFKQLAHRVNEAQENLNKVMQHVGETINNASALPVQNSPQGPPQNRHFFEGSPFSQFNMENNQFHPANWHFFGQPNYPNYPSANQAEANATNLVARMRMFWHQQVEPQIGNIRGQVNQAWRQLSSTGFNSYNDFFARNSYNFLNPQQQAQNNSPPSDLIDDILKSVDVTSPDFVLFDSTQQQQQQPAKEVAQTSGKSERLQEAASSSVEQSNGGSVMNRTMQALSQSQQMIQNGLINAQRELNQLWSGLTNSLQSTMARVRQMVNPEQRRPQFMGLPNGQSVQSGRDQAAPDPVENEIDGKLNDLTKLQRDADNVYETVRRQQEQQQQRASLGDQFRNFFHQFNNQVEQFPARFGDSMNRFGTAAMDLWHQIPSRWSNFVENIRSPQQQVPMMNRQPNAETRSSTTITTQAPN